MSDFPIRQRIPNPAYALPKSATRELGHLPGPHDAWLTGHATAFLRNDGPHIGALFERHGPLFVLPMPLGAGIVVTKGPAAVRHVLGNAGKQFSNYWAYKGADLFGDSIVTRDFDDHYELRRLVTGAFAAPALRRNLEVVGEEVARHIDALPATGGTVELYPFAKRFALAVAARVFTGIDLTNDPDRLHAALIDVLAMAGVRLQLPIPGTTYARGLRSRRRLESYFAAKVRERRSGGGEDFLSLLCRAENEAGERLADAEIVDNAVGALIAGHDTSTIAMASLAHELAHHPDWQERLRKEVETARSGSDRLSFEAASGMRQVEWCVNEVLRRYTPIRYILRRSVAPSTFAGHEVPANANVLVSVHHTHHDPAYFTRADAFLPERFAGEDPALDFDPFAFAPFGKGAHQCLGISFAMLEIKAFVAALLSRYRLEPADDEPLRVEGLPVSKPTTGVALRLLPR